MGQVSRGAKRRPPTERCATLLDAWINVAAPAPVINGGFHPDVGAAGPPAVRPPAPVSEAPVTDSNSGEARAIGRVASLAAVGLAFLLFTSGSVEVAGVNGSVWLLALVCYSLGGLAEWGSTKAQKG